MRRIRHLARICAAVLPLFAASAPAQVPPPGPPAPASSGLTAAERALLGEASRVSGLVSDSLWPGWGGPPFAVLLVRPDAELLIGHPRPTPEFRLAGTDPLLGSVLRRDRVFPTGLLASFPAVGGVPTIVVGTPAGTGKGATAWVLSVLHERFHQLQMSHPDYFEGVAALGLARGDTTGNWMLDYPFPYEDAAVRGAYVDLASRLLRALELAGTGDFPGRLAAYHEARSRFRQALPEADWRYVQLQLWQEGVARYTELRIAELAELAARGAEPDPAFRALPGYESYDAAAERLRREILEGLQAATLADQRRVAFYPFGAAAALLLDRTAPGWRARYFTQPFALDPYFEPE